MSDTNDFVKNLKLFGGKIEYNDFDIDENIPFLGQQESYKEDILQITFGHHLILDVGFYPEMDPNGCFVVYGIQDCNWESPLIMIECCSLAELKSAIEETAILLSFRSQN